jgi:hypothetical protein
MEPEALFHLAGRSAMLGWIALALSPLAPRLTQAVAGVAIPVALSIGYAALILVGWSTSQGGFASLPDVMRLFDVPIIALAGWVHYLAFDLLVGAWEARTARREGLPHGLLLPCLVLTFLFGPIGLLLFLAIRLARASVATHRVEA